MMVIYQKCLHTSFVYLFIHLLFALMSYSPIIPTLLIVKGSYAYASNMRL